MWENSQLTSPSIKQVAAQLARAAEGQDGEDIVSLLSGVAVCSNIADLLSCLRDHFPKGPGAMLAGIRFYRAHELGSEADARLEAVASFGHSEEIEHRFRADVCEKHFSAHPPSERESFICMRQGTPILCIERPLLTRIQSAPPNDGIPLFYVPEDSTDTAFLRREKTGCWLDVPLAVGGEYVGKLTCDIVSDEPQSLAADPLAWDWAIHIQAMATTIASHLVTLRSQELNRPLANASRALSQCKSYEHVYDFCARHLCKETYFDCEAADILTVAHDSFANSALILRRTSYEPMQTREEQEKYEIGPDFEYDSLTQWCASTRKPLRLTALTDPPKRRKQLAVYDRLLKWSKRIPLSDRHRSLLMVPILYENEVLGVLRLADKRGRRGRSYFRPGEEKVLQDIASLCVAPALKRVAHEGFVTNISKHLPSIRDITLHVGEDVHKEVGEVLAKMIPEGSHAKTYLISQLCEDNPREFRLVQLRGNLAITTEQRRFSCDGTATGHTLGHADEPLLDYDLDRAVREGRHLKCHDAVCCIMAPMRYGKRDYGTVAILSSHYDLSREAHCPLLQLIANELAVTMAHREVSYRANTVAALKHDIMHMIGRMDQIRDQVTGEQSSNIGDVTNTLSDLTYVHCTYDPLSPKSMESQSRDVRITDIVDRVIRVVSGLRDDVSVVVTERSRNVVARIMRQPIVAALHNIIGNALKYSTNQGRSVEVDVTARGKYIVIAVINDADAPERAISIIEGELPFWISNEASLHRKGSVGLETVKRVVSGYVLPGKRAARLTCKFDQDAKRFTVRLKVPCASDPPKSVDELPPPSSDPERSDRRPK